MHRSPVIRDLLFILGVGILLALTVNAFSAKRLSLVRQSVEKVAVADSALFVPAAPQAETTAHLAPQTSPKGTPVVAPLHEQALRRADSLAKAGARPVTASPPATVPGASSLRIVTLEQFLRLQRDAKPFIIDGRDSAAYLKGHVGHARNAYGLAIEDYFDRLVAIPRDTLVVVYCNNPDCHLGRMVIEFMHNIGFTNLLLYDDGWDGWEKAKMPVDTVVHPW